MQLGAKRAVDARATLLLGRGWCKTQNAHEARPRPSFRGQKAVSHVVWTQIPSTVLPPGQMAKCENCDSVHWQRQQSSVQVREPETGVEKVKRKWLQRTGPQVLSNNRHCLACECHQCHEVATHNRSKSCKTKRAAPSNGKVNVKRVTATVRVQQHACQ